MPVFKYVAINNDGVKIKGNIDAESMLAARNIIYQRRWCLLKINVIKLNYFTRVMKYFKTVNNEDLVLVTRQMSTLVNAAIPLDEVLAIIEKQNKINAMNSIIYDIRMKVIEGYSFSDSLSNFSNVFNPLYRSMITAGELSGHLGMVLSRLADHIEQTQKVKRKIGQTLIYPIILILMSLGVIIILLSVVVPNIVEQFSLESSALPFSTQVLMTVSNGIKNNILTILMLISAALIVINRILKIKKMNELFEYYYLKIPLVGEMIIRLNISRYLRTLTILNGNDVDLIQAIKISNSALTNEYIKSQLKTTAKLINEGSSLSSCLTISRVFSPMIIHMIASGERTGTLDVMLEKVTAVQEDELMLKINIFITILEPAIMVFMAAFIFFIVLSIFQPILQINSLIS
ncbi:type II secretion system F family protein [Yersinia sp. 2540 StPb PI]|uniref:type II secretion system F family protein n=1 Tax=Yersinia sp. 2540 StPb PI TaxID=3117406 RepID=UPI003FA412F6